MGTTHLDVFRASKDATRTKNPFQHMNRRLRNVLTPELVYVEALHKRA